MECLDGPVRETFSFNFLNKATEALGSYLSKEPACYGIELGVILPSTTSLSMSGSMLRNLLYT